MLQSDLDEMMFGGALPRKRGRVGAQLDCEIVRPVGEEDLEALAALPVAVITPEQRLKSVTYQHHQLAQYLARGASESEVSLVTGYSPAYISRIKNDPQFRELLQHYGQKSEAIYVDALERMKGVGLTALSKLSERLEEDDSAFSNRELMELTDLTLAKPLARSASFGPQGAAGGGVSVSVSFVSAGTPGPGAAGPVIDAVAVRESDK
jgi:hypothetical protein